MKTYKLTKRWALNRGPLKVHMIHEVVTMSDHPMNNIAYHMISTLKQTNKRACKILSFVYLFQR